MSDGRGHPYLDAPVALKLLVEEAESRAVAQALQDRRDSGSDVLVSSWLLHTERSDLVTAPILPGRLRPADAIHLATALRIDAHAMVVDDEELRAAAAIAGLAVLSQL